MLPEGGCVQCHMDPTAESSSSSSTGQQHHGTVHTTHTCCSTGAGTQRRFRRVAHDAFS